MTSKARIVFIEEGVDSSALKPLLEGHGYEVTFVPEAAYGLGRTEGAPADRVSIPGSPLALIEREAILRTLEAVGGSTSRAAKILGISPRKIQYKLKEYRTPRAT